MAHTGTSTATVAQNPADATVDPIWPDWNEEEGVGHAVNESYAGAVGGFAALYTAARAGEAARLD